jgi:hypothetical protein
MGLRIKVNDERIVATAHQQPGKVQRRRCLADAAFLIEHRDTRHATPNCHERPCIV